MDRVNRNAAGFRFFKYFMENLIVDEETFDYYNKFYCAVSGSIVNPNRANNYSVIKMKDINGKVLLEDITDVVPLVYLILLNMRELLKLK